MDDPLVKEEEIKATVEAAVLKKMRVTGILDKSPEVVKRLDATLTPGEDSLVVPVKLDKIGNPTSRSKGFLSAEQITLLRDYARDRMCRSAASILSGEIAPHPAKHSDQENACTWCSFGDVCHFDPHAKGMEYAMRESRDDAECWKIIRGAAEQGTEMEPSGEAPQSAEKEIPREAEQSEEASPETEVPLQKQESTDVTAAGTQMGD